MRNKQKILRWLSTHDNNPLFHFLWSKYELLAYLLFGVLTTLFNMVVFAVLETIFGQDKWYLSQIPAISLAILFAYVTNRSFVFDSSGGFWHEMYKFVGARIFVSLLLEYGLVFLLYNILHLEAKLNLYFFEVSWFKIISMVFVFTANYIVSKLFVFKNQDI